MAIRVVTFIGEVCVDPLDGRRLFEEIKALLGTGEYVDVDFAGVTTLTSSFLNEGIGRLYGELPLSDVDRRIRFHGLDSADQSLLGLVRRNAIRYYGASAVERDALAKLSDDKA